MAFVHLHVHTQYSILDGMSNIHKLFARAQELGMPALAITDHGNMYGVKEFFDCAKKDYPDIKPIIGCEVYVTRGYDHRIKDKQHNKYFHLILLAKNYKGYQNLMKIVSTAHVEGMYYRPRVSHEIIEKYHEGLICSSACMVGEVPQYVLAEKMDAAEEAIRWHKRVFGDDYYLEVMLHRTEVPGLSAETYELQKRYCEELFRLGEKFGVKVIATNDVHFIRKEDGPAHDRLLCVSTNTFFDEPDRLRYTQQEYLKSEEEMAALFPDHPEVLSNTLEIADKVENFEIERGHVLPKFELPEDFLCQVDTYLEKYKDYIDAGRDEVGKDKDGNETRTYRGDDFCKSVAYLCHLTYAGAQQRYGKVLNLEQKERIDFELKTISFMGFPDYFLIVQDFINWAKNHGISVGPGRGSAAGSVVAYCLRITNLDPLKYGLLFERFLNPERISMPDIDVDFDDEGRYRVFQYVEDRYGTDHISHVITFGTMAAKSAIKDIARISHLPLDESNRLTKLIPDRDFLIQEEKEVEYQEGEQVGKNDKIVEHDGKRFKRVREEKKYHVTIANCLKYAPEFKKAYDEGDETVRDVINYAMQLEGTVRQTGVHACAMIIGRGDLTDYIPITTSKDKATDRDVWVSQYEGSHIEKVGMLKMDFLGLRTLSIIKECLALIKKRHGVDIDIESIPIDDPQTYALFARGDTKSVFQFESPGMISNLQQLQPNQFEDLIAMNALYRPGPMDYIPSFISRKHGESDITYDLPAMEESLSETYGITVYQEQVMQLSRTLSGFSRGQADNLRKAMGKKNLSALEKLYSKFMEGGLKNGHPKTVLEKIWTDWRAFAEYAFNKSHATCYAWVAYQTGWLKAHYPAEFQAANLSQNLSNMDEIKKIMDDCKRHHIKVLIPDINESDAHFAVNAQGNIRFGLGGIKGFGDNVVYAILKEREENGPFTDVWEFMERMKGSVNRKSFETLVSSGCFDSFGVPRAQYLVQGPNGESFIDALVRYADLYNRDTLDEGSSLFGGMEEIKPVRPVMPKLPGEPNLQEMLHKEKELVGMYLSSHPLDKYRFEISTLTTHSMGQLKELEATCTARQQACPVRVAGLVASVTIGTNKNGKPFSRIQLEDYEGVYELSLWAKDHEAFLPYMKVGEALFIEGKVRARFTPSRSAQPQTVPFALYIDKVTLLGNVAENELRGFAIQIADRDPVLDKRKELVQVLHAHKGKTPLHIIFAEEGKYALDTTSRHGAVQVSEGLIYDLESLGVKCKPLLKR